ncbi:MAG: hypothetical protein ACFFCM_16030, partial [Promethearchaeota archaeon]
MPIKKTRYAQAVNDEILEKLSLENRYKFLNENIKTFLTDDQFSFLQSVEDFCLNFEKDNNIVHGPDEDIYDWVPAFGKKGFITRLHSAECVDLNYEQYGLIADFMRLLGT